MDKINFGTTIHVVCPTQPIPCLLQCLKLMVAHLPLATKNWAGPVKFAPEQVKIIADYKRREIFLTFLGDWDRAGVNSGIGIGIDTNSNSRNWNWKGIESKELELINRNWFNSCFLSSIPFDFFAMFLNILVELLNQFDLKPFWIQLTRISLDKYIILYDNLSI